MASLFVPFFVFCLFHFSVAEFDFDKRLKHFCVDQSSLNITGFRTGNEYAVFFYDGKSCFKSMATIPKSHQKGTLPNVTEMQIQKCTSSEETAATVNEDSNYYFDTGLGVYLWKKPGTEWRLINFNQVWIGCPQPICLIGDIDAAVNPLISPQNIFIFRGMYYWKLSDSKNKWQPKSTDARKIKGATGFFDCCYLVMSKISCVKGDEEYLFDKKMEFLGIRMSLPSDSKLNNCDAAVRAKAGSTAYVKQIGDLEFDELPLKTNFRHADAALLWNKKILLFKNHKFFEMDDKESFSVNDFSDPKKVLTAFFSCDNVIKSAFRLYNDLENKILGHKLRTDINRWKTTTVITTIAESTTSEAPTTTNVLFILAIVVAVLAIVMATLYFWQFRQKGEKKSLKSTSVISSSKISGIEEEDKSRAMKKQSRSSRLEKIRSQSSKGTRDRSKSSRKTSPSDLSKRVVSSPSVVKKDSKSKVLIPEGIQTLITSTFSTNVRRKLNAPDSNQSLTPLDSVTPKINESSKSKQEIMRSKFLPNSPREANKTDLNQPPAQLELMVQSNPPQIPISFVETKTDKSSTVPKENIDD